MKTNRIDREDLMFPYLLQPPKDYDYGEIPWMEHAVNELGQEQMDGGATNPKILEYFRTCLHFHTKSDETDWCSAFANWCMKKAGIQGTRYVRARGWQHWGRKVEEPVYGTVVVFWSESRTNSTIGHVGFYAGEWRDIIIVLGGNQGGFAPLQRNAVCYKFYEKKRLLAYRWPNNNKKYPPTLWYT